MGRTVIHLQIGNEHYYFGSLKALFDRFDASLIGISYGGIRNYKLSLKKCYQNNKVIIRKGILTTSESSKKRIESK